MGVDNTQLQNNRVSFADGNTKEDFELDQELDASTGYRGFNYLNYVKVNDTSGNLLFGANNTGDGGAGEVDINARLYFSDADITLDGGVNQTLDKTGDGNLTFQSTQNSGSARTFDIAITNAGGGTAALNITADNDITISATNVSNRVNVEGFQFQDNTLSSTNATLVLDPNDDDAVSGLVQVRGDLQVDGTTTTVNSTSSTLNDAVIHLGDVTSKLSVMAAAAAGVSTISVDRIVGINTGDILKLPGLPGAGSTAVTAYSATANAEGNYVITFSGTVASGGISTTTSTNGIGITVTHAYDTNTDRGVSFSYNTSTGTGNNKTGFFGYNDSAGQNSNAPIRSWTYIPDATVVGNVATGTRGMLDIAGLYYQSGGYVADNNDVTYFDNQGKLVGVGGTTAGITTSNYVLTTNAAGVPKWTTTLDGGTY